MEVRKNNGSWPEERKHTPLKLRGESQKDKDLKKKFNKEFHRVVKKIRTAAVTSVKNTEGGRRFQLQVHLLIDADRQ